MTDGGPPEEDGRPPVQPDGSAAAGGNGPSGPSKPAPGKSPGKPPGKSSGKSPATSAATGRSSASTQRLAAKMEAQARARSATAPPRSGGAAKGSTSGSGRTTGQGGPSSSRGPRGSAAAAAAGAAVDTRPVGRQSDRTTSGSQARREAQRAGARRQPGPPTGLPERYGTWIAVGAFLLPVANLPSIATSVFAPELAVLLILGAAGLPLLVARARGGPSARSTTEVWAARCAAAFLLVTGIVALVTPSPGISIVGLYQHGTGWLFFLLLAGCFGLGTGVGPTRRDRLELAIVAAACVNAVIGLGQQFIGLNGIGFANYSGQSDGLLGNPVFFGAFLAGALVLVAPRFVADPRRWWPVPALLAVAVGVSGERMPALLAVAVGVWVVAAAVLTVRHGRDAVTTGGVTPTRARTRADRAGLTWPAVFAAGIPVGVIVGSVLTRLSGGLGVVTHTADSTGSETYQQRFDAWSEGLRAFTSKPVFGYGPDQFRAAVGHLFPLQEVVARDGTGFVDAHDIVVEILVTTGVVGLALFGGWLVLGAAHRRGPLLGFAAVLLVSELVEPLNTAITPLLFLAVGAAALAPGHDRREAAADAPAGRDGPDGTDGPAAGRPGGLPRWVRPATAVAALVAVVPALVLVVGDVSLQQAANQDASGQHQAAVNSASTADTLLFPWPDPSEQLAKSHQELGVADNDRSQYDDAVALGRQAVARDRTNASLWVDLAQYQGSAGDQLGAEQSALQALRYEPFNTTALNIAAIGAASQHRNARAIALLTTSLAVSSDQSTPRQILKNLQAGCNLNPITETSGNANLSFSCPSSG